VRTHRKIREAGAVADLNVFEGMSHQGYLTSPNTPESVAMYRELKTFIDTYLGRPK
jgi:acetyl esterase/lipase